MTRSEFFDYLSGRVARIKGVPRDGRRTTDWLRGWDDMQAEYDARASFRGRLRRRRETP